MTAKDFEDTIDALLAAKPFQQFTVELRGGSQLNIDHPQALRREGVSILTDADGLSHCFDHESVVLIFESPTFIASQANPCVTPTSKPSTHAMPGRNENPVQSEFELTQELERLRAELA